MKINWEFLKTSTFWSSFALFTMFMILGGHAGERLIQMKGLIFGVGAVSTLVFWVRRLFFQEERERR